MPGKDQDDSYERATQRFARVRWGREAFEQHLGGETCKHPEDLYLGGAAGHRIDEAWQTIESEFAPPTQKVLARHALADFSPEELWSDTVGKLIAEDARFPALPDGRSPAYIIRYRGKVPLLNFLILVARRIAIQRKRRIKPMMRISSDNRDDDAPQLDPAASAPGPATLTQEREMVQQLERAVTAAWERLTPEQQFLIGSAATGKLQQKEAGEMLKLSPFQANRAVKDARSKLESALSDFKDIEWTDGLKNAWSDLLRKLCQDVQ